MTLTYLDEIIDYKYTVISMLQESKDVVSLLANVADLDMESEVANDIREHNFHDFLYVDETSQVARADIMVESAMVNLSSPTIKNMEIYVQVVMNKKFVPLNFQGVKGNRLDNLCRQIDKELRGSRRFGIGKLQIRNCLLNSVPDDFVSKMLVYEVPNFS